MSYQKVQDLLKNCLQTLKDKKTFKTERLMAGAQGPRVSVNSQELLMFASNNYLGLANNPEIITAAKAALDNFGFGTASVRFIAGTTTIHRQLEQKIAKFLQTDDAILFSSCFAANECFFAALTNQAKEVGQTSIIYSDELNHASIIDGLRLVNKESCVKRIYPHQDLVQLEAWLKEDQAKDYGVKIIVTDGVFSMEGELAHLPELVKLAEQYQCLLFVDDSHGTGATGPTGRGSIEELGVLGKVDVISGTLGKALGGAGGGFLAGSQDLIDFLRQKGRPYTFSNSLPPVLAGGAIKAIELLEQSPDLITKLRSNTEYFRTEIIKRGFTIIEGHHPIVPIMTHDAALTQTFSQELMKEGLYLVGLWFPVVPEGQARLRTQISAAHSKEDLDQAIEILTKVGKQLGVIK